MDKITSKNIINQIFDQINKIYGCDAYNINKLFTRDTRYVIFYDSVNKDLQINSLSKPLIQMYGTLSNKPLTDYECYGNTYIIKLNKFDTPLQIDINDFILDFNNTNNIKLIKDKNSEKYILKSSKCIII